jgi:hypothetical protein
VTVGTAAQKLWRDVREVEHERPELLVDALELGGVGRLKRAA